MRFTRSFVKLDTLELYSSEDVCFNKINHKVVIYGILTMNQTTHHQLIKSTNVEGGNR